jgi:hypothetical protein
VRLNPEPDPILQQGERLAVPIACVCVCVCACVCVCVGEKHRAGVHYIGTLFCLVHILFSILLLCLSDNPYQHYVTQHLHVLCSS